MAYCNLDDVRALAQPKPDYDSTTNPTVSEVSEFIDWIFGDMDIAVQQAGYALPITDEKALKKLRMIASWGSTALAEAATSNKDNTDTSAVANDWWAKYQTARAEIMAKPGSLGPNQSMVSGLPRSLQTSRDVTGEDENYSDMSPKVRRDTIF
jgi:hypothetical protein